MISSAVYRFRAIPLSLKRRPFPIQTNSRSGLFYRGWVKRNMDIAQITHTQPDATCILGNKTVILSNIIVVTPFVAPFDLQGLVPAFEGSTVRLRGTPARAHTIATPDQIADRCGLLYLPDDGFAINPFCRIVADPRSETKTPVRLINRGVCVRLHLRIDPALLTAMITSKRESLSAPGRSLTAASVTPDLHANIRLPESNRPRLPARPADPFAPLPGRPTLGRR